jgi:hypothetical protein
VEHSTSIYSGIVRLLDLAFGISGQKDTFPAWLFVSRVKMPFGPMRI